MIRIDPRINGALLNTYKAHLLSYDIGATDYANGYVLPPSSMIPAKLKYSIGLRSVVLKIDFEGETMNEITCSISEFTERLHEGAEILLPDGFTYSCVFKNASTPKEKAPWILQVEFTLEGYRHGALETMTLTRTGSIFVDGNCETPAILKIATSAKSAKVCGISVYNINGEVVIDGYKKKVMQNGVNKFGDTDMTEFPKFFPGYRQIDVAAAGNEAITVEVSYYPIYR